MPEKNKEPLGLPKGSVRGILAIMSYVGLGVGVFTGNTALINISQPIVAMVTGLYFGSRLGGNNSG